MNIFDFFRKKSTAEARPELAVSGPVTEKQITIDNVSIHAMPERFRNQADKMNSAKIVGLTIIAGGVAFLIIISAALYYFLFRPPSATETAEVTEPTLTEQLEQVEAGTAPESVAPATTTPELATLPTDESLATTTATTTPEAVSEAVAADLIPAADSDSDGLTDKEEGLLGTNSLIPDSDGDGYADGAELLNLYDPASRGKLTDNPAIVSYENKTFSYNVLYPQSWQESTNGGDDSVMFKSADNQFIQIVVQPNAARQTLDQWYVEQLVVSAVKETDRVSGDSWQGLKSRDGLTLYLMDDKKNYIFSLTYNPGESSLLEYPNIYQLLIKSFTLK